MLPTHKSPTQRRNQRKLSRIFRLLFLLAILLFLAFLFYFFTRTKDQDLTTSPQHTIYASIEESGVEVPQEMEDEGLESTHWLERVREKHQAASAMLKDRLRAKKTQKASKAPPTFSQSNPSHLHRVGKINFNDGELLWEENSNHQGIPKSSNELDQAQELDFSKLDWAEYEREWVDEPSEKELDDYSKQALKKVIQKLIKEQTETDAHAHQNAQDDQQFMFEWEQKTEAPETDTATPDQLRNFTPEQMASRVRAAFEHAWSGYSIHAWGHDEINPVTNGTNDSWGGFGATLVDALDTLFIMGFTDEFEKAKEFVRRLDFNQDVSVSFFETTIRHLGGLLSAFDLSRDIIFLQKAVELADRLLPAFNSPSGLPFHEVNLRTGAGKNPSWTGGRAILAEVGSFQLEWKYLSYHSGNDIYWKKATHAMKVLRQNKVKYPGLFPLLLDINTGNFSGSKISWGGLGDSVYEYELKQYLLTNKQQQLYRRMYSESVVSMEKYLLKRSSPSHHLYVAEMENDETHHDFEHLACFIPGMLILGAQEIPERKRDYKIAVDLMETCVDLYVSQPTGLAPDRVSFSSTGDKDYYVKDPKFMLRPETVESLYYLYKYTNSEWYRRMAWKIFLSLEKHCKTKAAYSGIRDVTREHPQHDASAQSFFYAETLKYLYLIFVPDVIDLSKIVFTTEAHILSRFDK